MIKFSKTRRRPGAIATLTILGIMSIVLIVMVSVSSAATGNLQSARATTSSGATFFAAEAGINEGLYNLIKDPTIRELNRTINGVNVEVVIEASGHNRTIRSTATDSSGKIRVLAISAVVSSFAPGIEYALQTGEGGLDGFNNSIVIGDIYSNGNIRGFGGAPSSRMSITGNAWVAVGVPTNLTAHQETADDQTDFAFANEVSRVDVAQGFQFTTPGELKKVGVFLRKIGSPNDIILKIVRDNGAEAPGTEVIIQDTIHKQDVSTASLTWLEIEFPTGPLLAAGTPYWIVLDYGGVDAGKYYIWGRDPLALENYADGIAMSSANMSLGSWNALGGDFAFRTYTGNGDTYAERVTVDGDLHAHTVDNVEVKGTGYYTINRGGSTIATILPYDSPPKKNPRFSDADIDGFKADANCSGCEIPIDPIPSGETRILGPNKIVGNLLLNQNSTLILRGNLWVTGDVTLENGSKIVLDGGVLGNDSRVLVMDGKLFMKSGTTLTGAGTDYPRSVLFAISTNNALTPSPAIDTDNIDKADVLYASRGAVRVQNAALVRAISGYLVILEQTSTIDFTDLPDSTIGEEGEETLAPGIWQHL